MDEERAERIGELFGEALSNFDDAGTFFRALDNRMIGRSYTWGADEIESVLEAFVEHEVDSNPPDWRP